MKMSIQIKDCIKQLPKDVNDLMEISEKIYDLGTLEEAKKKISPALFTAHVGIQMVGMWQDDGWEGIFQNTDFLPYIPQSLDLFGTPKIKEAFLNAFSMFEGVIQFCDGDVRLYDVMDFLFSSRTVAKNEGLKKYSEEEHAQLSEEFCERLDRLENLPENDALWGYKTPDKGWEGVLNYVKENYNA